jgi:hypothetical protein
MNPEKPDRSLSEEIIVAGSELVGFVKNQRRQRAALHRQE